MNKSPEPAADGADELMLIPCGLTDDQSKLPDYHSHASTGCQRGSQQPVNMADLHTEKVIRLLHGAWTINGTIILLLHKDSVYVIVMYLVVIFSNSYN